MKFADRFNFPNWNLVGWIVIVALWLLWEIWGASHKDAATFTYLIRNTVPRWGRYLAWAVLGWHFCWYDAKWWLKLIHIFR